MKRELPPFAAIRAFEAAARHMSFKVAAEEPCLSPSAISHQVRALEEFLATQLFIRDGRRLHLTLTGRAYQGKLTGLLDAPDDSTREDRTGHQVAGTVPHPSPTSLRRLRSRRRRPIPRAG